MREEEQEVFPFIKRLVENLEFKHPLTAPSSSVSESLKGMEMEHELVGGKMQSLNDLTHNYRIPAGACASYTLLLKWLKEFETDLHLHVHLENNILFPKAIELENIGSWLKQNH
jgi:regulator of cell morphogenesis and NO signaling